jgi:N-dimethylarginine dimethylaminohydrolase
VRARETEIIEGALAPWKQGDIIEFGDVLVFPDAVLVGLGDRTNMMAVETLRQAISGKEVIPVPLVEGTLHLDYATTIGGRGSMKTMVVCPELFKNREMVDSIVKRFRIANVIAVPSGKQADGWTNLFFVNPETVISTTAAYDVNARLRKIGFKVIDVPFDGILTGEGAPRCCTAPLLRED